MIVSVEVHREKLSCRCTMFATGAFVTDVCICCRSMANYSFVNMIVLPASFFRLFYLSILNLGVRTLTRYPTAIVSAVVSSVDLFGDDDVLVSR